jgi:hypothetical protein
MTTDITPIVRAWLEEAPGGAPEPTHLYPRLAARVHQTPQRRGFLPSLTGRFRTMFSAAKFAAAAAIVALFGGFLLTLALTQPRDEVAPGVDAPASAQPTPAATVSQGAAPRVSLQWGSKRIYYAPPPGWPWPGLATEFRVHDVARVAAAACARPPAFVDVGPTADDLTDALAQQPGLIRSGPEDVMVGGYPAKRFVILHSYPGCPSGMAGTEGHVQLWENRDGTGLGMLDGGFAIILVADVEGERLVFAGCACGHGFYGPPDEMGLTRLEADASALAGSIEIVERDPSEAVWVTGGIPYLGTHLDAERTVETGSGVTRTRGDRWTERDITMSDPRLSGTLSLISNADTYRQAETEYMTVFSGTIRIENEAGAWEGVNSGISRGSHTQSTVSDTVVLAGSGAYEGLTAYLVLDYHHPVDVHGLLFHGEMPPVATFE